MKKVIKLCMLLSVVICSSSLISCHNGDEKPDYNKLLVGQWSNNENEIMKLFTFNDDGTGWLSVDEYAVYPFKHTTFKFVWTYNPTERLIRCRYTGLAPDGGTYVLVFKNDDLISIDGKEYKRHNHSSVYN